MEEQAVAGDLKMQTTIGRVCDRCRLRKIRCDRLSPCSNCRTVQKPCSSVETIQRTRESKRRVLISSQYEQKMDRIELRLEGIEKLMQGSIAQTQAEHVQQLPAVPAATECSTPGSNIADAANSVSNQGDSETVLEGASSMKVATMFASDFIETAVERTSTCNPSPPVKAALSSLKQMTGIYEHQSFEAQLPHRKPMPKSGIKGLEMPPLESVLCVLREMKDTTSNTLFVTSLFIARERLLECCQAVYIVVEMFSLPTFLVANATLRYLFQDKALAAKDSLSAEENQKFSRLCRDNLETALANLGYLLYPNPESVEALLLGCIYAIETSKPWLARQLIWGAAGMCQTMGWHQLVSNGACAADRKISLFWLTYLLDRGLSLRLGRAPAIQDHDITASKKLNKPGMPPGWQHLLEQWFRQSEIIGKAYQELYSPSALRISGWERGQRATNLVAQLKQVMDDSLIPLGQAYSPEVIQEYFGPSPGNLVVMVLRADEVWYWTTMTLIHRAVPSPENGNEGFSVACLESARMAFEAHQECMRIPAPSSDLKVTYLLWTIISTPFIPFVVIFCNVIRTSNPDDIRILGEFCESLKPILEASESIQKLYKICQVLHTVAVTYVESKPQIRGDHGNHLTSNPALGRGPVVFDHNSHYPPSTPHDGLASVEQLRDWISGSTNMMELSEEDLSEFLVFV